MDNFLSDNWERIAEAIGIILAVFCMKIKDFYRYILCFRKSKINISGEWKGMSIYIPLVEDKDLECIYKLNIKIEQRGGVVDFYEDIYEIRNIYNEPMGRDKRKVKGKGRFYNDKDIIINLEENAGMTCGIMYLVVTETWGNELGGMIIVTNPFDGKPVVVKILLRRNDKEDVKLEDLGFYDLKSIYSHYFKLKKDERDKCFRRDSVKDSKYL